MKKIYILFLLISQFLNSSAIDLKGIITDNDSKLPLSEVLVRIQVDGKEMGRTTSLKDGSFNIALERNVDYKIYIDKVGYEQIRLDISTKFSASINDIPGLEIALHKLNTNIPITSNTNVSNNTSNTNLNIQIVIKGKVFHLLYGGMANEVVELKNIQSGKIETVQTLSNGNFSFTLEPNKNYTLRAIGNGTNPIFNYEVYNISTLGVQSSVQIIRNFENKALVVAEIKTTNNEVVNNTKTKKSKKDIVARNVIVKITDVNNNNKELAKIAQQEKDILAKKNEELRKAEEKKNLDQKKIDEKLAQLELERKNIALQQKLNDEKKQEAQKAAELLKKQEADRITAEQKAILDKKIADEQKLNELKKQQEADRIAAEQKSLQEKKLIEEARIAEIKKQQEADRIATEARLAEEKKKAEELRLKEIEKQKAIDKYEAEQKALLLQKQKDYEKNLAEQKLIQNQNQIADKIAEENRIAKEKELALQKENEVKKMSKEAYDRYLDSITGTGPRFMHREKTAEDLKKEGITNTKINIESSNNILPISVNENRTPVINDKIYFGPGKAIFDESAKKYILTLAQKLIADSKLKLDISIHADANDEASVASYLCKLRTKNITDLLINTYKVNFNQLTIRNTGIEQGANDCKKGDANCSELDHQMNRRIEFSFF